MKIKAISLILLAIGLCSCERLVKPEGGIGLKEDPEVVIDTCTFNPNFLNLEKYDIHLSSADTLSKTYVLKYNGTVPDIKRGNVLTVDADSLGYLIRVSEVQKDQNRITLKAEQACLCDLFANVSFILSTSTGATEVTKSAGIPVLHPVAVSYINQDGVRVTEDLNSQTKAISESENIWKEEINYDNTTLWQKGNTYLKMDECHINGSLDLEFAFSFGGFETLSQNMSDVSRQYRSQALAMDAKLIGTVNMAEVVHFHTEGQFNSRDGLSLSEYNEIVRHKVLPDMNYKFLVYGVPVWISVSTDLFREVNFQGDGRLDFVLGFRNTTELGAGFKWSQTEGITPVASASNTFTLIGPTLTGQGKVVGKCWPFYPRINVRFYSVLGPNFDIKPYLQCTLEGGFQLDAGGNSFAGWSLKDEAGLDFKAGLSTYFMNYEASRLCETDDMNLYNTPLYTSPIDLKRSDSNECKAGTKSTLTFEVIDRINLLDEETNTYLPQIVTFKGDGTLSKKFALTSNGSVSVDWTPSTKDDTMEAIIYGPNGETIKKVTVEAVPGDEGCPDENHVHAIDLGLSVKWACCNVGATKPEEYGGYYQWAGLEDVTSTSIYLNFDNCPYHTGLSYSTRWTKYIPSNMSSYWSGSGSPDNKTILDPEDDVAHVTLGGSWRMPTEAEFEELYNSCTSEWTILNGVYGKKFTSRKNGNSIFLPAAGGRFSEGLDYFGSGGFYWSSSLRPDYPYFAYLLYFHSDVVSAYYNFYRYIGLSVRPVSE